MSKAFYIILGICLIVFISIVSRYVILITNKSINQKAILFAECSEIAKFYNKYQVFPGSWEQFVSEGRDVKDNLDERQIKRCQYLKEKFYLRNVKDSDFVDGELLIIVREQAIKKYEEGFNEYIRSRIRYEPGTWVTD